MFVDWLLSTLKSSTPVSVIVCATFQSAGVKTRLVGETPNSLLLSLLSVTVTVPLGAEVSTKVLLLSLLPSPTLGVLGESVKVPVIPLSLVMTLKEPVSPCTPSVGSVELKLTFIAVV